MPDQTRYADLEALKIFKEEYDIKIDEKLNEKINISQGSENAGKILTIDDSGNIIPGNPEVQKATHSSTADTATNAENAVNAEHATSADSATTAESATKATQDASGNIITDTYETKEDAIAKFDEVEKKSVMLVTMTTGDSENFVVDKTFEEVYSHVANGGTAVLYDAVGVFPMTYLYCASADADDYVMFMNTLVDVSDFETYISYCPQGVFSYGIILSNDNTVSVKKSNFDLLTTEINALNTNSKTVTGAINEVNAKALTQSDWSVNDESDVAFIKNRPFYHYIEEQKEVTLTFDGNLENYEYVEIETSSPLASDPLQFEDVSYAIKITDVIPMDTSCFVGSTAVTFSNNEESSVIITEDDIFNESDGIVSVGNGFLVVLNDNCEFIGAVFSKGIYFLYTGQISVASGILSPITYAKQITYTGDLELIKKIDDRFQHQSDWNVNDKDSASYIKNRTHWDETTMVEILPECTLTYDDNLDGFSIADEIDIAIGNTYTVKWNGASYTCVAWELDMGGVLATCIGNASCVGGSDTGEPFFLLRYPYVMQGVYAFIKPLDDSTEITISISACVGIVHKLDEKYLPDSVLAKSDWNATENELGHILNRTHYTEQVLNDYIPETTLTFESAPEGETRYSCFATGTADFEYPERFVDTFKVEFNNNTYVDLLAREYTEFDGAFGDGIGNTGMFGGMGFGQYPFLIGFYNAEEAAELGYNYIVYSKNSLTTATLRVARIENVVHQLDEKYLPETTKYQSDWNVNDESSAAFIENRTHYVEKDVVILPETTVDISSEISIIENPFIVLEPNKTYTVIYDGTEYECVCSKVHFSSQSTLSVSDIGDMYYLGNSSIVGISDVDTGEPFLYVFSMSGQDSILYLRDTGTHEIQIKNITEIKSFDVTTDNVSFNHPFLYCPKLTIGQEYTVVWDNVEYKCVALDENAEQQTLYVSPDIIIGLGNKYMLNEDFEDTGEPFFFYFGYFSDGSGTDTSILMAYEGEHSYQIKDVTGVHGFYLNEENSITLSENTVNYNVLNAGKEYDIIINSVTYQSLCQLSGNSYSFEINNLNESLSVENPNYMQIYVNKNGELHINVLDHGLYNIEIVGDIYHKIDKDFIPKEAFVGIPGEGVLSEVFNGGQPSQATGIYSHAEGSNTTASGDSSHAEGSWTIASGSYSHAEGITTTASGSYSHAEGRNTTASGIFGAHAEGGNTTASGRSSHAEGYNARATGGYSHSEGYTTEASGNSSHAEGNYTFASGESSHAEGYMTESKGIKSHAEGTSTIASGESQHVQGKYNIEDTSNKYAHIVGNGTSESKRSNAHTVDWSGNAWYQGDVYVGGTSQDDGKKLATEDYVDNAMSSASENSVFVVNFELTDNEDYTGYNVATSTTFDEVYSAIQEGKTVIGHATFGAITCVLHAETIKSSRVCFVCIDENLSYEHITKLTIEMSAYYDAACRIHNLVAYSDNNSIEATSITLKSPNGTRFSITVGDDGVLKTDEITE